MSRYRKSDVETWGAFNRRRTPAINVKVYNYARTFKVEDHFKCDEKTAEQALTYAFESAQSRFWEDVQEVARSIFGKSVKVYSAGRSGGWLTVDGINEDVESWDAIYLSKWARLVKWCEREIAFLTSWDYVRDDIEANEWAKDGAELYNFLELKDGRTVTMSDLKNAHKPKEEDNA